MDLQHIGVKLFVKDPDGIDLTVFIPIFHAWIQDHALDELMLIDVADYSHVHAGPGVMLICHEGHIAMDEDGGRLGLVYANKRLATGSVADRLRSALRRVLTAAQRLEAAPQLAGKIAFRSDELALRVDDRLHAPNTVETFDTVRPDLQKVFTGLYNGERVDLEHVENPKTGLTVNVSTSASVDVATLLARTAAGQERSTEA